MNFDDERLKAPKKIYAYDPGMINAVRFRTGAVTGLLLESIVAIELLRRRDKVEASETFSDKSVRFMPAWKWLLEGRQRGL